MEIVKFPEKVIRKLRDHAPTYTVGENSGRRSGYSEDSVEYARGYKSICIYIQSGLADNHEQFKEIAKGIFKIQVYNSRKYPLLIFGFGNSDELKYEDKFFSFGYSSDSFSASKVADAMVRLAGQYNCNPAIIPSLWPKTSIRSLYSGKINIESDDMLIIIGREKEVFFSDILKDKLSAKMSKRILFVEFGEKSVLFRIKEEIPLQFITK
jgi:hypothetical protein